MNLYLISQDVNNNHEVYKSAVICADTEDEARMTHPGGIYYNDWNGEDEDSDIYPMWCTVEDVKVEKIGFLDKDLPERIICVSRF